MLEGTQAIWPSKEVHCPEHVCGVRDAMPFDRLGEQSVGVVHAARLLVVESRYFARGFAQSGGFGTAQLQIENILKFDCRKDALRIERLIVDLSGGYLIELKIEPNTFVERPEKVVGKPLRVRSLWTKLDIQHRPLFKQRDLPLL